MIDTEEGEVAGKAFIDTALELWVPDAGGGVVGVEGLLANPGDGVGRLWCWSDAHCG